MDKTKLKSKLAQLKAVGLGNTAVAQVLEELITKKIK